MLAEPLTLNSNLGLYTNFANLLDLCAISVPAGHRDNATGFGVSLVAPAWSDDALMDLASRYEAAGAPLRPPALDVGAQPHGILLAVVGAHLAGMPLHWQLASRAARPVAATRTAPTYRLYAMAGASPPKPALVFDAGRGAAIDVEVYELSDAAFGSFVAAVPPPLAIGTVVLADGSQVKGFVAEPRAIDGATEITALGGLARLSGVAGLIGRHSPCAVLLHCRITIIRRNHDVGGPKSPLSQDAHALTARRPAATLARCAEFETRFCRPSAPSPPASPSARSPAGSGA